MQVTLFHQTSLLGDLLRHARIATAMLAVGGMALTATHL